MSQAINLKDRILYEDNHILVLSKLPSEIVQADKTGDDCLLDCLKLYIKNRDGKNGNVFLGLPHRLDRPTSGIVIFAKTSKSLSRLTEMFKNGEVHKTYLALVDNKLSKNEGIFEDYIYRNSKLNKSFVVDKNYKGAKKAILKYKFIKPTKTYFLYEIELLTGRHHQIRVQFSSRASHIKGDVKYGARRANDDASICLHSYKVHFIHPVSKKEIEIVDVPKWKEIS